jgi:amino-acid N-acetyltransferase
MSTEHSKPAEGSWKVAAGNATVVRPARPSDLAAVLDLLTAARLPVQGVPLQGVKEGFGEGYAAIEHNGAIVGAAGIEIYGRLGLLRSVVVDPPSRGAGLAKSLLCDRLTWAESLSVEAVYLLTTSAADYFSRFGFGTIDRKSVPSQIQNSVEFRLVCPTSATVMCLPLEGDDRWGRSLSECLGTTGLITDSNQVLG